MVLKDLQMIADLNIEKCFFVRHYHSVNILLKLAEASYCNLLTCYIQ